MVKVILRGLKALCVDVNVPLAWVLDVVVARAGMKTYSGMNFMACLLMQ